MPSSQIAKYTLLAFTGGAMVVAPFCAQAALTAADHHQGGVGSINEKEAIRVEAIVDAEGNVLRHKEERIRISDLDKDDGRVPYNHRRQHHDDIYDKNDDIDGHKKRKADEGKYFRDFARDAKGNFIDTKHTIHDIIDDSKKAMKQRASGAKDYIREKGDDAREYAHEKKNGLYKNARDAKQYLDDKSDDARDFIDEKKAELHMRARDAKHHLREKSDEARDFMDDSKDAIYKRARERINFKEHPHLNIDIEEVPPKGGLIGAAKRLSKSVKGAADAIIDNAYKLGNDIIDHNREAHEEAKRLAHEARLIREEKALRIKEEMDAAAKMKHERRVVLMENVKDNVQHTMSEVKDNMQQALDDLNDNVHQIKSDVHDVAHDAKSRVYKVKNELKDTLEGLKHRDYVPLQEHA